MVFPTLQFVLFFAVVLALAVALQGRVALRKGMLLAVSYAFYAVWDARFVLLMFAVSFVSWSAGLLVLRPNWDRWVKAVTLTLLLGTLGIFKYANFFMLSLAQMLSSLGLERDMAWAGIILPVGISFYIFQAISYVMDVSRRDIEPRQSLADVALYISFFPQLVAGPIVRAADFLPQIDRPRPPDAFIRAEAVLLILAGLVKKLIIANYLSVMAVDPVFAFPEGQDATSAWVALIAYAVQIYCDFSGYSDISIGVALLLGYRFQANFRQPYRARSLRDFWQRWHISLSAWIRDYLYIPLGGNRGGALRASAVLVLTMTLAGLWHGAAWPFVIWGLAHGIGLVIERLARSRGMRLPGPLAMFATFSFVVMLWLPFRAGSGETTLAMMSALLRGSGPDPLLLAPVVPALVLFGLALNFAPTSWQDMAIRRISRLGPVLQATLLSLGVLLLFALAQEGTAPFIYFQF